MSAPGSDEQRFLLSWRPASVLAIAGVWTGLALLSFISGTVAFQHAGRPLDVGPFAIAGAIEWYSCAVFTPLYVWMARRWPLERATWKPRAALLLVVTAAVVPLRFLIADVWTRMFIPGDLRRPLSSTILTGFLPETVAFWAMIAAILSIEYYDRWRHREIEAHRLGRQLAEARLDVLAAQLRPHFLFNALQGISTLLHRDVHAADQMLTQLSALLRESLRTADTREVPLTEELATLEHYLAIQRVRFEDRLHVRVDANGTPDALVPHFLLQPLVENAIEHGIARRAGPGNIDVIVRTRPAQLVLEVRDDGVNCATEPRASSGVGLANTRARLQALYGSTATLDAGRDATGSGYTVQIVLPLRRAGDRP